MVRRAGSTPRTTTAPGWPPSPLLAAAAGTPRETRPEEEAAEAAAWGTSTTFSLEIEESERASES